ncbi:Radical SAM domain protein [Thermosinus carboxydivorans Nor1]|uniref:Radical SAM domain protein n=2 Tax=Thermosinus TaxID=261684 RepID=A1HN81_9FIRM|nr:Radical SAM domain protein [Thermosinus carboxydivorans Nor1]
MPEQEEVMKHYIIPIFIPHYGCHHRCIFCNQRKITGVETSVTAEEVGKIIAIHLARLTLPRYVEVAFYGGSFTALSPAVQRALLQPASEALRNGRIQAIRVSTRPDCISLEIVDNLVRFGVSTIELGVQSLDDAVLAAAARGHDAAAVVKAVQIIKAAGVTCGLQLMPGLPGEDWPSLLRTAVAVGRLSPSFVRIYPAVVITDTDLAALYRRGQYTPLTLDEAVRRSAFLKLYFESRNIQVVRVGLQATEELSSTDTVLAGPFHPAFGEMVESRLFYYMLVSFLETCGKYPSDTFVIHHHPRDHSKVRGIARTNITLLRNRYRLGRIVLRADGYIPGELIIETNQKRYLLNKLMLLNT